MPLIHLPQLILSTVSPAYRSLPPTHFSRSFHNLSTASPPLVARRVKMASFNSAVPQFTNQLAYQSVFSPPGFSFETPFGYPPSTSNANSTGGANENAMQQQQHQHQQHREDYRMGMDDGMNGLVAGSTEAESSASGSMQVAGDMWKSAWPMPMSGGKVESPSLQ